MKKAWTKSLLLACLLGLGAAGCSSSPSQENTKTEDQSESETKQNTTSTDKSDDDKTADKFTQSGSVENGQKYLATISVKDYGDIVVELDEGIAPITTQNFVKLAREGFYDGLTFHRIIDGFMIQGGDPTGTGMGGSDETIVGEFAANGYDNTLSHERGVISMARSSDPDSASSQFFIVHEDSPHLDGNYAAFGHVVSGMDVVDAIATDVTPTDGNGTIDADDQPVIEKITVEEETE